MSSAMNKHATIEDVVFSMQPLLGNGMVHMCVAMNECSAVEDPLEFGVFCTDCAEVI
jgi:hypothetical protein